MDNQTDDVVDITGGDKPDQPTTPALNTEKAPNANTPRFYSVGRVSPRRVSPSALAARWPTPEQIRELQGNTPNPPTKKRCKGKIPTVMKNRFNMREDFVPTRRYPKFVSKPAFLEGSNPRNVLRYIAQSALGTSKDVVNKLKEENDIEGLTFSPDVIAKVSQIVLTTLETRWASDVIAFSTHAKRATITADDVKLLFHKNPNLAKKLEDRVKVNPLSLTALRRSKLSRISDEKKRDAELEDAANAESFRDAHDVDLALNKIGSEDAPSRKSNLRTVETPKRTSLVTKLVVEDLAPMSPISPMKFPSDLPSGSRSGGGSGLFSDMDLSEVEEEIKKTGRKDSLYNDDYYDEPSVGIWAGDVSSNSKGETSKNSALKDVGNTRPSYDPALDQQGLVYEFEKRGPQSRFSGGSRTGQFKRWSTSSNATAKANSSKNYSMQSTRPSYGSTIAGGNATALANNSRNYSMQSARPSYGSTIAGGNATALANNSRNYSMQSARPSIGSTNAGGNQSSKNNQKDNAEDDRDSFYDDDEDLFKDLI
ncbi:CENP-S protein [Ditylenchus destructor]|nr:CENP-S protein [Ditylenchus destructor]